MSSPKLNQSSEFNRTPLLEKSSGNIVESRYDNLIKKISKASQNEV
jgi:hypothetical protein